MQFPWTKTQNTVITKTAHETDFCQWAKEQENFARRGKTRHLELEHIGSALHRLVSEIRKGLNEARIEQISAMLTLAYQPVSEQAKSELILSITSRRLHIKRIIQESPSLKDDYDYGVTLGYKVAVAMASLKADQDTSIFPETCPWTPEQIEDINFLPL